MRIPSLAVFALALGAALAARADEGMWLFNAPPTAQIKARYGFEPTQAWLDHLMRSSVRFNSGGSGSFVSADGLVITNHHVGLDSLQKMSDASHNYAKEGYLAHSASEEVKCVDLELNVLQSIEDVTARVNAGVPAGLQPNPAAEARRKVIAAIEKESRERTGLRSDVVTLYQGGAYHLYRYKRYTDVRLVFAPEQQAAFYGGDPDNFEYPRFDMDICIFRVYENGHALRTADYLQWSASGAGEGELVFVSGHPGATNRQYTLSEWEMLRDVRFPAVLETLKRREVLFTAWSARSDENARRAKELLFYIQNSRKVRDGELAALQDPEFVQVKRSAEEAFRAKAEAGVGGPAVHAAFDRITQAVQAEDRIWTRYRFLEAGMAFDSDLFGIARTLLRLGDERTKPNGERLTEFADAKRESLELQLFSAEPIYPDFEILRLGDSLSAMTERLGASDPLVQKLLAGKSPRARAVELVNRTQVGDVAFRRRLAAGGAAAVAAARDPMIELARIVDAPARAVRKEHESFDEQKKQAHAVIERARFALGGSEIYPDATFTLRLAYGAVLGYEEDGRKVPAMTTIGGLYERAHEHHNLAPYDLPPRWVAAKSFLNLAAPMNFVHTCDIIGGNSGSPTVNKDGQFVGIIFDGNIQSLSGDEAYDERQSRAISVASPAIIEALRKVYGAGVLADELLTGKR